MRGCEKTNSCLLCILTRSANEASHEDAFVHFSPSKRTTRVSSSRPRVPCRSSLKSSEKKKKEGTSYQWQCEFISRGARNYERERNSNPGRHDRGTKLKFRKKIISQMEHSLNHKNDESDDCAIFSLHQEKGINAWTLKNMSGFQ